MRPRQSSPRNPQRAASGGAPETGFNEAEAIKPRNRGA